MTNGHNTTTTTIPSNGHGHSKNNSAVSNSIEQTATNEPLRPPTEYRVYKRRFLGLGVLMLLNIMISWGWLTYAPVADITATWFGLSSQTPVNWLSTVIFFSFIAAAPYVP
jgi:hypothetical protein